MTSRSDVADVAGRFRHAGGFWWLRNQSLSHRLELVDRTSRSVVTIPPGIEVLVAFGSAFVDLYVDRVRYRLFVDVELPLAQPAQESAARSDAQVVLNRDQRILLVILAEAELRTGTPGELPSNSDVAERLGWSASKLNRKLDHLAVKFTKLGVDGLRGSRANMANDRRARLVDHALRTGLITAADLAHLRDLDALRAADLNDD